MSITVNQQDTLTQLKRALAAIKELRAKLETVERSRHEPIAIIGMGCRLPAGIDSPAAFWQALSNSVDMVGEVPAVRWQVDALYDADVAAPGKMNTRWGAFLERVDHFDPAFFGISPIEATHMDPQQRLMLEVAYEAMEYAGQTLDGVAGSQTGVFVGIHSQSSDYYLMQSDELRHITPETATGTAHSIVANRLSYVFDLHGPSFAVDTACSSALVAIHLACQSLRNQECDMAFSGGVNLILSPEATVAFSKLQMMSPEGHCKTFDAGADGFVRGEGCGLVLLKRLSDAQRDGDVIHALILGSAVNQDGRTNGMTAPNSHSQEAVIQQALRNSHIDPAMITFVETHGTGTELGDPIEVEALANTIGRVGDEPCYLGSVKANIGHLEGGAGVAGLLKLILALQHGMIPPQLHFQKLNPHISLEATRFAIPTQLQPWPSHAGLRHAAVSSFGFGGTNGHLIVSSAPLQEEILEPTEDAGIARPLLLPISARTSESLRDLARRYQEFLATTKLPLPDICYSASVHRSHLEHRLAVVGATPQEMSKQLETFVQTGTPNEAVVYEVRQDIVFVFSGQGSQWAGMGQELLIHEPLFKATIQEIDTLLQREGATWSLLHELAATPEQSGLEETEIAQPAIFALQVALVALFRGWGITPDAVVGHSVGEVASAYVAGVLTLSDAVRLVFQRGRIMQKATWLGKMAAIGLSQEKTEEYLQGYRGRIFVAAVNSPISTVVAGEADALAELLDDVLEKGYFGRMLAVNYAFHTPQMEPFQQELRQSVAGLQPRAPTIPIYSTVSGRLGEIGDFDAGYWGRNVLESVKFSSAISAARADGYDAFLEVGPHPVLNVPMTQCVDSAEETLICSSLHRDQSELSALMKMLAALHGWGYPIAWQALYPSRKRFVKLPAYPWQHKSYWLARRNRSHLQPNADDALQSRQSDAESLTNSQEWLYDLVWRPQESSPHHMLSNKPGHWLILVDKGHLGDQIAKQLEGLGQACTLIMPGSHFDQRGNGHYQIDQSRPQEFVQLLQEVALQKATPLHGIIYLWGLDTGMLPNSLDESYEVLTRDQTSTNSALYVLQALTQLYQKAEVGLDLDDLPKLWFVTEQTQAAGSPERMNSLAGPSLAQASLWGLGKVVSLEHPELWGGLIDLESQSADDIASLLIKEFLASDGEDQVAYREGKRYVARLASSAPSDVNEARTEASKIKAKATYLITGGLGGIGLHLADWLVTQGARHLVLTSRTGLPERTRWEQAEFDPATIARITAIRELEARGASVEVATVDVADMAQMSALFDRLGQSEHPLRGIFHAAGSLSLRPLLEMDLAEFHAVMRPKVIGGWLLHQLTQKLPLDFFVLFSSVASVWGSTGMAHYAAANQFLDALAHHRRALGLTALSINWGWWRDGGMATPEVEQLFTSSGIYAMSSEEAMALMGQLLNVDDAQKTVAAVEWPIFKPIYEAKRRRPLLEEMRVLEEGAGQGEAVAQEQMSPLLQNLVEATPVERGEILLAHVCSEVARLLGYEDPSAVDLHKGFFKMGMNSLMTVQLKSRLESNLNCTLPTTLAFEYPTIQKLTTYLANEVLVNGLLARYGNGALDGDFGNGDGLHVPPALNTSPQGAPADQFDSLASEDLLAMFDEELAAANALVEGNRE